MGATASHPDHSELWLLSVNKFELNIRLRKLGLKVIK